jgi:hypothetical protein
MLPYGTMDTVDLVIVGAGKKVLTGKEKGSF